MRRLLILAIALMLVTACGRKANVIPPGTILPQTPAALTVEPRGSAVLLAFTAPDKDTKGDPLTDLAGYEVMRAELPEDKDECPCLFQKVAYIDVEAPGQAVINGRRVAWADRGPGLAVGRKYVYKVAAVNKDGYPGPDSAQAAAWLLAPPAAPEDLKALPSSHTASLSWDEVTKDNSGKPIEDIAGYNVYRLRRPDGPLEMPVNQGPVTGREYTDAGLVNGEAYYYRLAALRGKELPYTEGEPAAPVMVTPADVEPPAPPAGLRAVPGDGAVFLSWEPNVEPDLAGYRVYRRAEGEKSPVLLNDTLLTGITYTDAGAPRGKTCYYTVTAVDNATPPNESGPSEAAGVTLP
jgi:hypothetical protein